MNNDYYDPAWGDKLATELKNRNNPNIIGHTIGKVVSLNPIKISILDNQAFFSGDKLRAGDRLKGYTETVNITINGTTQTATIEHFGLQLNDNVICQFTQDNQILIVLDKIS